MTSELVKNLYQRTIHEPPTGEVASQLQSIWDALLTIFGFAPASWTPESAAGSEAPKGIIKTLEVAIPTSPPYQSYLLNAFKQYGVSGMLQTIIAGLLTITPKPITLLGLNQNIENLPIPALWPQVLPPRVLYRLNAKGTTPTEIIQKHRFPPLRLGEAPGTLEEVKQSPDYPAVFINLFHHLEDVFSQVSPAVLKKFLQNEGRRKGVSFHTLQDYLWSILSGRTNLSYVNTYSTLLPHTSLEETLWSRETPFTNAELEDLIVDWEADILLVILEEDVKERKKRIEEPVLVYIQSLLRDLWKRLVAGQFKTLEEIEAAVPGGSQINTSRDSLEVQEAGEFGDEGEEGRREFRAQPIADLIETYLFPSVLDTLLRLLPSHPTFYDVDTVIAQDPGLRNLLDTQLPMVLRRFTLSEWLRREGPQMEKKNLNSDAWSSLTEEEIQRDGFNHPSYLSTEGKIQSLMGSIPPTNLPFLLKFVNHFEDLFHDFDDEQVQAWLTENLATQFPSVSIKKETIRQNLRDLLLGVLIGGALRYAGSSNQIDYPHLLYSAIQNPYFDLKPYLTVSKLS